MIKILKYFMKTINRFILERLKICSNDDLKTLLIERLKIDKNTKLPKQNFFCIFVDNKYLNPKIKISIDPYIYYHFCLDDLPGIFRDVYIFYYDELVIKKIKGFFDESSFDEIVAWGLLPKEYDNKDRFKQFQDDLINDKIDLDDIEELKV